MKHRERQRGDDEAEEEEATLGSKVDELDQNGGKLLGKNRDMVWACHFR